MGGKPEKQVAESSSKEPNLWAEAWANQYIRKELGAIPHFHLSKVRENQQIQAKKPLFR